MTSYPEVLSGVGGSSLTRSSTETPSPGAPPAPRQQDAGPAAAKSLKFDTPSPDLQLPSPPAPPLGQHPAYPTPSSASQGRGEHQ